MVGGAGAGAGAGAAGGAGATASYVAGGASLLGSYAALKAREAQADAEAGQYNEQAQTSYINALRESRDVIEQEDIAQSQDRLATAQSGLASGAASYGTGTGTGSVLQASRKDAEKRSIEIKNEGRRLRDAYQKLGRDTKEAGKASTLDYVSAGLSAGASYYKAK